VKRVLGADDLVAFAVDAAGFLQYRIAPGIRLGGGYRTIEGGADVPSVYTFARFNAAVVRVGVEF